jgi:hypothetical protein
VDESTPVPGVSMVATLRNWRALGQHNSLTVGNLTKCRNVACAMHETCSHSMHACSGLGAVHLCAMSVALSAAAHLAPRDERACVRAGHDVGFDPRSHVPTSAGQPPPVPRELARCTDDTKLHGGDCACAERLPRAGALVLLPPGSTAGPAAPQQPLLVALGVQAYLFVLCAAAQTVRLALHLRTADSIQSSD